eukprot:5799517-Prymnesium_polylepis.1
MRVQVQLCDSVVARCVQMRQKSRPRRVPRGLKRGISARRNDLSFGLADQRERRLVIADSPQLSDRGRAFEPYVNVGAAKQADAVVRVQVPHVHAVWKKEATARRRIVLKFVLEELLVPRKSDHAE